MQPMRDVLDRPAVIYAVIVSYRPDLGKLVGLLEALAPQVQGVVVVDNGSSETVVAWLHGRRLPLPLRVLPLGENLGIARAQNDGIRVAREAGADHVILFDQDSVPASGMVAQLLTASQRQAARGIKVAGVGPNYLDSRQDNPPPFIKVSGLRVHRQLCTSPDAVVEVDYLIASGCLIPMSTIDEVGGMRDDFFIDYVDIEWGLRAKTLGFQTFGVCGAMMAHDLGDEPIEFFGKRYPLHSPLRHYYHFRNAVWMYRRGWLPIQWRLVDGWRLLLKLGFYTLFAKPRLQHLKMMTKGVVHGLIGRMGRLN
jgi:rhamnosyltransferase